MRMAPSEPSAGSVQMTLGAVGMRGMRFCVRPRRSTGMQSTLPGKCFRRAQHGVGRCRCLPEVASRRDWVGPMRFAGHGVFDDVGRGAVFDGSAWVGPLGFTEDLDAGEMGL